MTYDGKPRSVQYALRFRDRLVDALLIVVLLLAASALTSGKTQDQVQSIQDNTHLTAQFIQAQTCVIQADIDARTQKYVAACYRGAGLIPFIIDTTP